MKTKNLIILSAILLIIVLLSYIIFNKQKKSVITEETTTTTKIALCSNKYLTTEYDARDINGKIGGKIIIKDWPWDKTNAYETSQENQGYGSPWPASKFLSLDYIKDLSCVQRIELYGGTNFRIPWSDNENIEKLSSLNNLEEIEIQMENVPNGDINNLFPCIEKE